MNLTQIANKSDAPVSANSIKRGALVMERVCKSFGPVTAVDNVTLSVKPGEFVSLLGSSGSGKSTLLMMIAGFEAPSSGDILLDDVRINETPSHRRGFGIVFQNYALFPNMTVAENIAYPLRRRGVARADIEREVTRVLKLIALDAYGLRYPAQLSGGQQQRVALARALVFRPPILLMDEPLGALDRKLRQQLQMEIKLIHKEIGSTIIFVTHDQEEALSMSDRIAVLEKGRVQQFGSPRELYEAPATSFVADFVGETNFLSVNLKRNGAQYAATAFDLGLTVALSNEQVLCEGERALLAVRPEYIQLELDGKGSATVIESAYTGTNQIVLLAVGSSRLIARPAVVPGQPLLQAGQRVRVAIDPAHVRVFPADATLQRAV